MSGGGSVHALFALFLCLIVSQIANFRQEGKAIDPRELSNQRRDVRNRIDAAARALAEKAGIEGREVDRLSAFYSTDREINTLRQQEATADLLEALVKGAKEAEQPAGAKPRDTGESPAPAAAAPTPRAEARPAPKRGGSKR